MSVKNQQLALFLKITAVALCLCPTSLMSFVPPFESNWLPLSLLLHFLAHWSFLNPWVVSFLLPQKLWGGKRCAIVPHGIFEGLGIQKGPLGLGQIVSILVLFTPYAFYSTFIHQKRWVEVASVLSPLKVNEDYKKMIKNKKSLLFC